MKPRTRLTAVTLLTAIGLPFFTPLAAHAGSKGRQNTAIAAGAVGLYGIVKKKPLLAGAGTGVALYSYMKSREDAKKERARRNARRYYKVRRGGRVYRHVYYRRR